ncbi:hypothetical protein [Streptomyces sp. NPDC021356]|uniref:hypothetical protein n=1 Tax=Streptomyces sp. NPDC021356 TaxID=3154900 RepID=UPI0033EEF5C8
MSRSERTNLPDVVVAGEEYRDTTVTYRLATRLTGRPEDGRDGEGHRNAQTGAARPDPP